MDNFSHTTQCLLAGSETSVIEPEKHGRPLILTINGGSSSLKFSLFEQLDSLPRLLSGAIERIGQSNAQWSLTWSDSSREEERSIDAPDQNAAVQLLIEWLGQSIGFERIKAVGHRIVHGGSCYEQPEIVTNKLIEELYKISPLAPDHLPGEIEVIEAIQAYDPNVTQIVCFDTAFHHDLPRVAQLVPIPRRYERAGVRRYGFHGLSYEFLMEELRKGASPNVVNGRIILAHLGAGASLVAVRDGRSIDTTMGFTPASGLVMGTRTGDIDPGLVRFLERFEGMNADQFDHLVNHESGLLGVSETSSDVRDLLSRQSTDVRAAEAIELFCYQVKKGIGAFAAALGGLDTLVFTGGIGEHSSEIRRRICDGLEFLGITLEESLNDSDATLISTSNSRVQVRVIRTNEELMIAKSVNQILNSNSVQEKRV